MLYFNSLPRIVTPDQNGNNIVLTNLMARAKLIEDLQNNPMLFYEYSIQEGDTPEIVAEKYYGDSYDYWIVLYSNELLDPVWSWPLTQNQFNDYIDSKYAAVAAENDQTPFEYTNTHIQKYEKITTTTDLVTDTVTTVYTTISQSDYNSLMTSTNTYTLPNGDSTTIQIDKRAVTIYAYEYDENENKRQIKILNDFYLSAMQQQFVDLMSK